MPRRAGWLLGVLCIVAGCSKIDSPTQVPLDQIIRVSRVDSETVRADGASTTVIQAVIPSDATTRSVTFKTSGGSFRGAASDGTITAQVDPQGIAKVPLVAPTVPGDVTVTATVESYSARTTVTFAIAYPDSVAGQVSSLKATLDGATKPLVTVLLSRTVGKVSTGTPVVFTASQRQMDGTTRSVGRFTGIDTMRSDEKGLASASFVADTGDISTDEPVILRASSVNDAGIPVFYEVSITVM